MNIVKSINNLLNSKSKKEIIVECLLDKGLISGSDAVYLLRGETNINIKINDVELSSGAKIIAGDDNETRTV